MLKCIYCDRDMLASGPRGDQHPTACHYAEDHPTGRPYYSGDKDVRPVQVIVRFFVDPEIEDPRGHVERALEGTQRRMREPVPSVPDFEVLPQVWKYTSKDKTRNIGGTPVAFTGERRYEEDGA